MKFTRNLWVYSRIGLYPLCLLSWYVWNDQHFIYVMGIAGFVHAVTDYLEVKSYKTDYTDNKKEED